MNISNYCNYISISRSLPSLRYFENRNIFDRFRITVSHVNASRRICRLESCSGSFSNYHVKTNFFDRKKCLIMQCEQAYNYLRQCCILWRFRDLLEVPGEKRQSYKNRPRISTYSLSKKIVKYVAVYFFIIVLFIIHYKYVTCQCIRKYTRTLFRDMTFY